MIANHSRRQQASVRSGQTVVTASPRTVVVRVLTALALSGSLWLASARSAQAQTAIVPLRDPGLTSIDLVGASPPRRHGPHDGDSKIADRWFHALTARLTSTAAARAVTVTVSSSAAPGRADLTITGSGGGLSRTAPLPVVVSAIGGEGPATATPVVVASGPWFNEEQVRIANPQPLTALTLTITVETTGRVTFNGQYNTVGSLVQTHSSTASAITYQYTLGAGQALSAGAGWIFAARSSASGALHPTSGDTYAVTYTAGGASFTVSGHF